MSVDSEKTPDSSQKALEDIRPEHGALTGPVGPPTALGPAINPFWSESAREEALLRACRPAHLPSSAEDPTPQVHQQAVASVSPQRDIPDAVKAMVQSLVQENSRLWSEREFFAAGQGGWHAAPGAFGGQPPWMGGPMTVGHPQESMMGAMMEMMKASFSQATQPRGGGLLGPLTGGDRGGFLSSGGQDHGQGIFGGFPKGNLMDLFNLVSGGGRSGGTFSAGGMDGGRGMMGQPVTGRSSEGSGRSFRAAAPIEAGSQPGFEGHAKTVPRREVPGGDNLPPGDPACGPVEGPGGNQGGARVTEVLANPQVIRMVLGEQVSRLTHQEASHPREVDVLEVEGVILMVKEGFLAVFLVKALQGFREAEDRQLRGAFLLVHPAEEVFQIRMVVEAWQQHHLATCLHGWGA